MGLVANLISKKMTCMKCSFNNYTQEKLDNIPLKIKKRTTINETNVNFVVNFVCENCNFSNKIRTKIKIIKELKLDLRL